MPTVCREMQDRDTKAWDDFVHAHPHASFFHLSAWKFVIEKAFKHKAHFILAEQDGSIVGVMPLVHMRSLLFGRSLVSMPFCVYGGPVGDDAQTVTALAEHAQHLRAKLGVPVSELRFRTAEEAIALDTQAWLGRPGLYVTFRRPITGNAEADMKAIPRKQRAMVRKGQTNGLASTVSNEVDGLHAIYAESVHNLGTPVFSRRYFEILMEAFKGSVDVLTVLDDNQPIAAVMNFYFRDQVLPYYGGGTRAARGRAANDFMYWEVMRRAGERGIRLFDFGRSKHDTGSFSFKKNWGFEPEHLHYRFNLAEGAAIPEHNPNNPRYSRKIAAWKKLPLPVANAIGPYIVRGVG